VDGNVKFSEFVDMEKNEVVDTTASQETSEVAEDETEGSSQEDVQLGEFIMTIDDYFKITEIGVYIVGTVESSTIYPGDKIVIVGENGETYATQIESMEMLRKDVTEAKTGEYVGIQIGSNVKYENIDYKMSVYRAAD
jgi:translation elongation factor EF-Tu-like GTPase